MGLKINKSNNDKSSSIRKHYFLDEWVIIAENRKKRPFEYASKQVKHANQVKAGKSNSKSFRKAGCPFCLGNEALTPKEKGRIVDPTNKNKWIIRWFNNKFAAVAQSNKKSNFKEVNKNLNKELFSSEPAFGVHEIIVETPNHNENLSSLKVSHIKKILNVYTNRINELERIKGIKYVVVFKNHGAEAGASLSHEHTQVIALNKIPIRIKEELDAFKRYKRRNKSCLFCDIIKEEKKAKKRIVLETKNFIVISPFAPRFGLETWILPKKHLNRLSALNNSETIELAKLLKRVILKLDKSSIPYNFVLHYAPKGEDFHFYIEIMPRINKHAGFESTGFFINSISPETTAELYRRK